MKHLKRQKVPTSWPVPRKGTAYVVKPYSNIEKGVPLLVVLRDMLKVAKTRKEVKRALHEKNVLINGRPVRDEKNSAQLFDKITLVPAKKSYKINLAENGKFKMEEVKESETNQKIAKIINKKLLKGKRIQINLSDGRNFISDIKCNVGDSVSVDFKNKKIEKCLPMKEGANVIVFAGKHSGKRGKILKSKKERKMVSLETKKEKINVLIKQIMVTE